MPEGFAHGYQTQVDKTMVEYYMTDVHVPALADGVRYNDPRFGITWPIPVTTIVARDATYPDYRVLNGSINRRPTE